MTRRDSIEYCILAALINNDDGENWDKVKDFLVEDMFKYPAHRVLFHTIEEMREKQPTAKITPYDVASYMGWETPAEAKVGIVRLGAYMTEIVIRFCEADDPITGEIIKLEDLVTELEKYNGVNNYNS